MPTATSISMARTQISRTDLRDQWEMPASKRVKISNDHSNDEVNEMEQFGVIPKGPHAEKHFHDHVQEDGAFISSTSKLAPEHVAPFLAKHIPSQYAPQGGQNLVAAAPLQESNTKFCYRHRPDMLCRRQADEPSMDKLQKNLEALPQEDRQAIVQIWSTFSAAPSKYRNLMLQGILAQCCFPQLSFLSANVRELIRIDFLSALPSEIAFRILCFLDTTSLCKAAQVSRKWRQLADDDVVWHRMCEQHIDRKCTKCGWGLPLLDQKRLRASKRQMQLRAAGRELNGSSSQSVQASEKPSAPAASVDPQTQDQEQPEDAHTSEASTTPRAEKKKMEFLRKTRPWKDVYRDRFRVGTNWKYGRCSTKVLKGHANGIMTLQVLDNILATGSYDSTIKIWDLDTGEEIRTLTGHSMGIRCLQFDHTKLISGSMDKTLKVWNWRTGECIATYRGHSQGVIGLHFDSNVLVSGAADCTARVWNFEDKSVVTLRGHGDWVNSVRIDTVSRTVFTASDDFTVKMWDLDTQKCIRTFEGHVAHVQQVVILPQEFEAEDEKDKVDNFSDAASSHSHHTAVSSSYEGYSPILTQRMLSTPSSQHDNFGQSFEHDRPAPPRYILTSALDNTIRLWEVATGRCIRTFFGHVEGVWALAADTLRIVSGAEDRMVKVWDPRTGKCERTFTGHSGPITCIGLSDSRMCSAGEDGEVRVYCFSDNC